MHELLRTGALAALLWASPWAAWAQQELLAVDVVDCAVGPARDLAHSASGVRNVEILVEPICVQVPLPSGEVYIGVLTTVYEPRSGLFWWGPRGDVQAPDRIDRSKVREDDQSLPGYFQRAYAVDSAEIVMINLFAGASIAVRKSPVVVASVEQGRRLALDAFSREVGEPGRGTSAYRQLSLKPHLPPAFLAGKESDTASLLPPQILRIAKPEGSLGWEVTIAGREDRSARIGFDSQLGLQDVEVFGGQASDWDFVVASPEPQKDAFWLRAWRADRGGRRDDAIATLVSGAQEHPDDRYWCQTLVDLYLRKGNDTEALAWFPRCEAAIVESRRQLAQRGGRIALRQDLLKAGGRAFDARRTWELLDHVAGAYARRGDKARALDLLEQAMPAGEARKVLASVVATGGPEQR